ncbi:MAG: glycosyltransferase family 9 protein [Bacteroidetes bacterium]|nr:glycosyltransferase family 9 protein [Bacteroidota bacterium]
MRCIKQQLNNAEVHFFTKKQFEPIIAHNPYIDKYFLLDHDIKPILQQLKQEKYDYVIDLHHNLRTAQIKFALRAKAFSFDKLNLRKLLLTQFKINKLPDVHIVQRYMDTVTSLGVMNDDAGLNYFIAAHDEVDVNKSFGLGKGSFIVYAIGGQHATKRLPSDMISSIVGQLKQPVILIGSKEDDQVAQAVLSSAKNSSKVINACGLYNLNQSVSIVSQSKAVLTHDTAMMHVAAAFRKPVISVWGNTTPRFGMSPYYGKECVPQYIAEVSDLGCRPCSKLGYDKCPKGHFNCMRMQDVTAIAQAANRLFEIT